MRAGHEAVGCHRDGAILRIEICNPPSNALDNNISRALGEAFRTFRDDPALRVAVLSAKGNAFSSGAEHGIYPYRETCFGEHGVGGFGGLQELRALNKPVVACLQGPAVDAGMELALACDLIYASDTASFTLSALDKGDICAGAAIRLPRRVPYHIAMEMLYTGRTMEAREAQRWGLVNDVLPSAELVAKVDALARTLAAGPPLVFAAIKEVARVSDGEAFQTTMNRVTRRQLPTVDALYGSQDMIEGFKAFAEKRAPVWQGR